MMRLFGKINRYPFEIMQIFVIMRGASWAASGAALQGRRCIGRRAAMHP
jgi:hypothetical protein